MQNLHYEEYLTIAPVEKKTEDKKEMKKPMHPQFENLVNHGGLSRYYGLSSKDIWTIVIVVGDYPFTFAENEVRLLVKHTRQDAEVWSADTIRNNLDALHAKEFANRKKYFQELSSKIAFTTDIWTSPSQNRDFMAVTAHYITDNWKLERILIAFDRPEDHGSQSIYKLFTEVVSLWGIERKIMSITMDNVNTNTAFARKLRACKDVEFSDERAHVRCFAHVLNLAAQDAISCVEKVIFELVI